MWPFKSVDKIKKSGLLTNFTDWHSHILPGVDDGIRTMEESLATLAAFENAGVRKVWLTPHVMEDSPNTTDGLRQRFEELKNEYKGSVELALASENMLDSLFEERLEAKDFLPIGEEGRHLLVETSYVNPPFGMESMIDGVFKAGYIPILAHPERYRYMEEQDYRKWKSKGVLFQANYMSLLGGYGETARKKLEWLLKEGMINLTGSDVHRQFVFEHMIEKSPKRAEPLRQLVEVAQNPIIK
ncbi:MAG: capsular biosynthesis protein [Bacteroides sp.]|nr:capsular biosynthesis protein [Bacteroidales bacterium]MBD5206193.1 capsular biosynthesis protein [Bacteroidales bacterium]MBD5223491.1 capsular biosynthesis protein [Bacteroidales bacterium]MBD5303050.1 capsular biosynthesis protein [Bacteroides sp.]MBD5305040.1 capsular biosynthesis protein [Bacteroides sp.]